MNISNISKENVHKLSDRVLDQNQNNNGIAEKLIPYPKHILDDLELEHKCHEAESKYRQEHDWQFKSFRKEYPFKQLWYNRQCENWWQKWWLCDIYLEWKDNDKEVQDCYMYWWTPWWPEYPVVRRLSEEFDCDIEYGFDEPWMWFSWVYEYSKWELITCDDYDDAYYGHWKECPTCGCMCDDDNPDDWLNHEHTRCIWCDDVLDTNHLQHED